MNKEVTLPVEQSSTLVATTMAFVPLHFFSNGSIQIADMEQLNRIRNQAIAQEAKVSNITRIGQSMSAKENITLLRNREKYDLWHKDNKA